MGDGINDAPSIHMADVGVSVATAVDVAKDAADIILLNATCTSFTPAFSRAGGPSTTS
jgi:P-type E1-E2 ATPase